MAVLEILTFPDPRLKQKAVPVEEVTPEIQKLLDDMIETMIDDDGAGLAATQVGVLKRALVIYEHPEGEFKQMAVVNPEIIERSEAMVDSPEGCLSVGDERFVVPRHEWVKVKFLDYYGKQQEMLATGMLAIIFQHEIDHLDGKLFIDLLPPLKQKLVKERLIKQRKKQGYDKQGMSR